MRRGINEKKAWKNIFIGTAVLFIFIGVYGFSAKTENIILAAISIVIILGSWLIVCYSFYSLGWEYKRLSLEEDRREIEGERNGND